MASHERIHCLILSAIVWLFARQVHRQISKIRSLLGASDGLFRIEPAFLALFLVSTDSFLIGISFCLVSSNVVLSLLPSYIISSYVVSSIGKTFHKIFLRSFHFDGGCVSAEEDEKTEKVKESFKHNEGSPSLE